MYYITKICQSWLHYLVCKADRRECAKKAGTPEQYGWIFGKLDTPQQ